MAFKNSDGKPVLMKMVDAVQKNKIYLSEVDGLIGDGDHGMNMNKGFTMFGNRISEKEITFTEGLEELGTLLFTEIGGSMGPIYGTIFTSMADAARGLNLIDVREFATMFSAGLNDLHDIVEARVGDKTLVDVLTPVRDALILAESENKSLASALKDMKEAAAKGRNSTINLVAKYGRSSRLGERSRGALDAGAVSCCIILSAMADGILELIL